MFQLTKYREEQKENYKYDDIKMKEVSAGTSNQ